MRVSKWGDSLAILLPKALVDQLGLKEGDELKVVAAREGTIEVGIKEQRRQRAIENMRARNWPALPAGYKFGRDEANKR